MVDGCFGYCLFCLNFYEKGLAIINSAKIGMISYLLLANAPRIEPLRGRTFQEHSKSF